MHRLGIAGHARNQVLVIVEHGLSGRSPVELHHGEAVGREDLADGLCDELIVFSKDHSEASMRYLTFNEAELPELC